MDSASLIMCDTRASGITADLNDSYFDRSSQRPSGGVLVAARWPGRDRRIRVAEAVTSEAGPDTCGLAVPSFEAAEADGS